MLHMAYDYGATRENKTHAEIVCGLIANFKPIAVSLPMGYMVKTGHKRIDFSDHYGNGSWDTPRKISEARNKHGRCTGMIVQYADGSRVRYSYSDSHGARYMPINGGKK